MEIKNIFCGFVMVLLLLPVTVFGGAVAKVDPVFDTDEVAINESVKLALKNSPRLKILQRNRDALAHELRQAKGGRLPSLNLTSSYGMDEHSDITTRQPGADPADNEWEERGEVALILRQLLYDGGDVFSRIAIQQAKLDSGEYRVKDNAESIALDAVIAHLSVYRQTRLMTLAENNIGDHEEILSFLVKRQKGGAGSSADVAQVQGRLSRARATLYGIKADLAASVANYERVVGSSPGKLQFAKIPEATPANLDEALALTRKGNPKILAFGVDVAELESKYELTRSPYSPKFFLELSKSYQHQVAGDPSWQDNNAALVKMNWNLYNGGTDVAGREAALSRVQQGVETLQNEILYAVEDTQSTWAQYKAVLEKKNVYTDAIAYNRMTLDAYMKQFNVSQRSLLDVLDAENELFQSSGLLVTEQVNELIAAGRILALNGVLVDAVFPPMVLSEIAPQKVTATLGQTHAPETAKEI